MFKTSKAFLLATALSLAAVSAAQAEDAPGGPTDNTGRSGAGSTHQTGGVQSDGCRGGHQRRHLIRSAGWGCLSGGDISR
jgi:hypothetical protein